MLHPCARGDVAIPRATRLCAEPITRGRRGTGHKGSSWEKVGKMLGICTHFMQGTPYVYQGEELGMTNPGFTSIDDFDDVESKYYYRTMIEQGKSSAEALRIVNERSRDDGPANQPSRVVVLCSFDDEPCAVRLVGDDARGLERAERLMGNYGTPLIDAADGMVALHPFEAFVLAMR